MKKLHAILIVSLLICCSTLLYAQTANNSITTYKKITTPKGNTWMVKKTTTSPDAKYPAFRQAPRVTKEYLKANKVPDGYPVYTDTGNPKTDSHNYFQAKKVWVKAHPAEFEKIKNLNL